MYRIKEIAKIYNKKWREHGQIKFDLSNYVIFLRDLLLLSKKLLTKLQLPERAKILDIGGATGKHLQFYFGEGNKIFDIYLVDISNEALKIAKGKGFKVCCADVETTALPFSDNTFDLIIASELIEHLYDSEMLLKEKP